MGTSPSTRNWHIFGFLLGLLVWASPTLASTATLQVSATIPTSHQCKFTNNGPLALNFGILDPLAGGDVTRTASIEFECKGNKHISVVYSLTDDDGLHESGSNGNRMKHATLGGTNAFIPYQFSLSPTVGSVATKTPVTLTVTGTILASSYRMAYGGSYSDTVLISLNP